MKTFSLNRMSSDYAERILAEIEANAGYIVFFNKGNVAEARHRIFARALRAEKPQYTELGPYIRKLARTVMLERTRDIPYAAYNEDGEVAFVFTSLTETPNMLAFESKEQVMSTLQELYLRCPEDFMLLHQLIPCAEAQDVGDIGTVIKNKELKNSIFSLVAEHGGTVVFYSICEFLTNLLKDKAEVVNATLEKVIVLKKPDYRWLEHLSTKKWLLDANGVEHGINPRTLQMDGDFNPEFAKFRLSMGTSCRIWRIDCSDFYNMLENKVYVENGVDNEYIRWCGSKYSLTTPAGSMYIGIDRDKYMELVRQELVLNVLNSGIGTLIAVSPDNLYIKLTRATALSMLKIKAANDKVFTLPVELQQVEYAH